MSVGPDLFQDLAQPAILYVAPDGEACEAGYDEVARIEGRPVCVLKMWACVLEEPVQALCQTLLKENRLRDDAPAWWLAAYRAKCGEVRLLRKSVRQAEQETRAWPGWEDLTNRLYAEVDALKGRVREYEKAQDEWTIRPADDIWLGANFALWLVSQSFTEKEAVQYVRARIDQIKEHGWERRERVLAEFPPDSSG